MLVLRSSKISDYLRRCGTSSVSRSLFYPHCVGRHPFFVNLRYAFQDDDNCFFVLDLMLGDKLRCTSRFPSFVRSIALISSWYIPGQLSGGRSLVLNSRVGLWSCVFSQERNYAPMPLWIFCDHGA